MISLTTNTVYGMISHMVSGIRRRIQELLDSGTRFREHPGLVRILAICVAIEISLVLLDLTLNWWGWSESGAIRRLFNITREDGLASLFAIIQSLLVALVLWGVYIVSTFHPQTKKRVRLGWGLLAGFFTYVLIDDGAKVHERIGTVFKQSADSIEFVSYGWQYVLAPAFILCGIFVTVFIWSLGKEGIRRSFLIFAMSLLGFAMAVDFLEGVENGYLKLTQITGIDQDTLLHFSKSFEEFIEMLGMSILLVMFLEYLSHLTWKVEIHIAKGKVTLHPVKSDGVAESKMRCKTHS